MTYINEKTREFYFRYGLVSVKARTSEVWYDLLVLYFIPILTDLIQSPVQTDKGSRECYL